MTVTSIPSTTSAGTRLALRTGQKSPPRRGLVGVGVAEQHLIGVDGVEVLAHRLDPACAHLDGQRKIRVSRTLPAGETPRALASTVTRSSSAALRMIVSCIPFSKAGPTLPTGPTTAALDCMAAAVDHWTASEAQLDLGDLLDAAFAALTVRQERRVPRIARSVIWSQRNNRTRDLGEYL